MAKKALEIDGILGSQLRDTQGETLSIEGADISELEAGRGRWNDNHGKGFFNSIGRITSAKKIFKAEDCDNDRQRYYWDKIKTPFIYGRGYLYDNEDHPNAKAAAAILRNIHKSDIPLKLKLSVEGGVISRGISDPSLLARTKIHSCAITFTPANNATLVEPLNLNKSQYDEAADMELIKSVIHLAENNVPSFRHIARDAAASKVVANMEKIAELMGDSPTNIPTKQEIIEHALEAKIQSNIARIHEMVETMKGDEMEKGLKEKALGVAMMGAAALAPQHVSAPGIVPSAINAPTQNLSSMPKQHQDFYRQISAKNPVLGAIGKIESSGGLNYKHKPITDKNNVNYGHTAGGMFGMMPLSAEYALRNDPKLATKYPKLAEAAKDMKTNHGQFTDTFNRDPQAAFDFADSLLKRNKNKTKDLPMLLHSWNHGLKGTWNRYKEDPTSIQEAPYVQKVLQEYSKLSNKVKRKPASKPVEKSLTAGYGGAGAPTNMTGGGVLQAEALDSGRDKLKYVTCDGCGKEQVYAKHQVKCRNCGDSWSLAKLHKVMSGRR